MTAILTLEAAASLLRRVAGAARGARTRERIDRLADLAEADPAGVDLNLGLVVEALFPDDRGAAGVARFRDLRSTLRRYAAREGVELICRVDGQKHAPPDSRRCWFEGVGAEVRGIERLSQDATAVAAAVAPVPARARRPVRVCIDGPGSTDADGLTKRLGAALTLDRDFQIDVSDTRVWAGERPLPVRAERLRDADVAVCLLNHAYLVGHAADELGEVIIVPVALEPLGEQTDLRGFEQPFELGGRSYSASRRKAEFVNALAAGIIGRLRRPDAGEVNDRRFRALLTSDLEGVVDARALCASLAREPLVARQVDDTVDLQQHLREWAEDPGGRPYVVIFGEYGMGKTTACQVFTRALLERREAGDMGARLPIYLDLRRLSEIKASEPTLEQILQDLLARAWQSGAREVRATARDVIRAHDLASGGLIS